MSLLKTRHPTDDEIVKMTATELGRAVFWHQITLRALKREQVMRFHDEWMKTFEDDRPSESEGDL